MSRRSFATVLAGGGVLGASLVATGGLVGCSDGDSQREKNRVCLDEWFAHTGEDRLEPRMACWNQTDDTLFSVPLYFGGESLIVEGYDAIYEQERLNVEHYSTWAFNIVESFECVDPNQYWFKVKGEGILSAGDDDTPITLDPMILFFEMKDGKIQVWEEYFNPLSIYVQSGITLPEMY